MAEIPCPFGPLEPIRVPARGMSVSVPGASPEFVAHANELLSRPRDLGDNDSWTGPSKADCDAHGQHEAPEGCELRRGGWIRGQPVGPLVPGPGVPVLLGHDAVRDRIDAANGIPPDLLPPAVSDRVIVDGREVVVPLQSRIEVRPSAEVARPSSYYPVSISASDALRARLDRLERENVSLRSDVAKWKAERDALMADAVRERRSNR